MKSYTRFIVALACMAVFAFSNAVQAATIIDAAQTSTSVSLITIASGSVSTGTTILGPVRVTARQSEWPSRTAVYVDAGLDEDNAVLVLTPVVRAANDETVWFEATDYTCTLTSATSKSIILFDLPDIGASDEWALKLVAPDDNIASSTLSVRAKYAREY